MTERSVTVEKSLKALSDDKTLILFEMIARQELHPYNFMRKLGLTKRQYYSRMLSILAAGLIKRKNGVYSVTSFGKVVYKAQTLIGRAVSNQWKLSAIDTIEMNSTALLQEEIDKLMNLLIDNDEIREIIVQHPVKRYTDKTIVADTAATAATAAAAISS